MHLKTFLAGTAVGIALTVSVVVLWNRSDPPADRALSQATPGSAQEISDNGQVSPSTTAARAVVDTPDTNEVGTAVQEFDQRVSDNRDEPLAPVSLASEEHNLIPVTDSHKQIIENTLDADSDWGAPGKNHRDLENEPRDHDWSYFMEQSIGQFLGNHPEIARFDIAGIECRSTMCEIQSFGVDESAGPIWGIVIQDLRNQPWSDFGQTGSSSSTIDGRLVIITHLRRLSDEE